MSAIQSIGHVLMLDAVIYVKPSPMHWQLTQTGSCLWWQRPFARIEPSPMHLYTLPIPMGSGKTHWKSTSSSSFTPVLICSAEISPILQPGTPQIKRVYSAMEPFQASRPVHSQLPSRSIPRGSGKITWKPTPTSTFIATPCCRSEISLDQQPGTPQIEHVYGAMNPLLAYTLALMHLPAFHIPRASGKTTWEPT